MEKKPIEKNGQENGPPFGHAVVIGGSIAGLTAAAVLTRHFARVTIIERDRLPDTPGFRPGVPQARHAHILPLPGQDVLEQQFPGLAGELLAQGAIPIDGGEEMAYVTAGRWHRPRHPSALVSLSFSRPLLDSVIYRRVANHPRVSILQEQQVTGLQLDGRGQRVVGVSLRQRHRLHLNETDLAADLVVDASGRDSQAPKWLAGLGFTPPQETIVNAFPGYASRIFRQPAGFSAGWKALYVKPVPPARTRGGMIVPIEGDRWHVVLIGMAGDYPPTDEEGFMAFARSLPTPALHEAIGAAEPLTRTYGYRRTENRTRHYERLPRFLEGLLVCGDAAYVLDPVYGQGMTAAAIGGLALETSLQAQRRRRAPGDVTGLARTFQQQLSQAMAGTWQMVTSHDRRWPATVVTGGARPLRRQVPARRPLPRPAPYGPAYRRAAA